MCKSLNVFILFFILGSNPSSLIADTKKVKLDETFICYPSAFSPDTSFVSNLLSPIADQLDSSTGQELIYIPALEIKKKVPEYTLSHINSNNVKFEHSLTGIAYAKSQIGQPNGMALSAWNVYQDSKNVFIEKDSNLPFTRVYEFSKPIFMWHLVKFPPHKNPKSDLPTDWYIGSCGESAGSYDCRQSVKYKSIHYEYHVQAHDMHLRKEIKTAVISLLKEWSESCNDT